MKLLQSLKTFADADKLNRNAGNRLHGKSHAAARVAVEFRQNNAVEFKRFVKSLGAIHCVLTHHRVNDKVHLIRIDFTFNLYELLHQVVVDMKTTGSIEDNDVDV